MKVDFLNLDKFCLETFTTFAAASFFSIRHLCLWISHYLLYICIWHSFCLPSASRSWCIEPHILWSDSDSLIILKNISVSSPVHTYCAVWCDSVCAVSKKCLHSSFAKYACFKITQNTTSCQRKNYNVIYGNLFILFLFFLIPCSKLWLPLRVFCNFSLHLLTVWFTL